MRNLSGSGSIGKEALNRPQETGRGAVILVLGILSILLLGPLSGIPAWVMGRRDMKKIEAGIISYSEKTPTHVGKILGMISTLLVVIAMIVGVLVVVVINVMVFEGS